jgi:tetratricopeptide (TPR) repeat protein
MNTTPISSARPTTEAELENLLRQAYSFAKKGDYISAFAICNWLIEDPFTILAGKRKRAAVYEHQGDIEKAVEDLESVISSVADEAADMYSLGLLYLQVDRLQDAVAILAKGIQICLDEKFEYYLNSCRILRAEALLRLRRADQALLDLGQLPPGYSVYVYGYGIRTKEAMIAETKPGSQPARAG